MATYSNTNSETITSSTTDSTRFLPKSTISDTIIKTTPLSYLQIFNILESIVLPSPAQSSSSFNNNIVDYFQILNYIFVTYEEELLNSITALDHNESLFRKTNSVLEVIINNSTTVDNTVRFTIVNNLLKIADFLDRAIPADISETLNITSTLPLLYKAMSSIIDTLVVEEDALIFIILSENVSSGILTSSSSVPVGILESFCNSSIFLKFSDKSGSSYLAYLLSPETNSVSTYTNYNFNGCTKFGYKYLFYNRTGLYEHGGNTDNGSAIRSEMETVAFNFKTSNLKQVPSVYLGIDSSDKVILKVRVDGKAEVHYQLNKFTNNLMTQKIDIGKGLIGRYFQFELITEASEFNMESIEFYPLEIRRKL